MYVSHVHSHSLLYPFYVCLLAMERERFMNARRFSHLCIQNNVHTKCVLYSARSQTHSHATLHRSFELNAPPVPYNAFAFSYTGDLSLVRLTRLRTLSSYATTYSGLFMSHIRARLCSLNSLILCAMRTNSQATVTTAIY